MEIRPTLQEFMRLGKQGNVIPVYLEINADLDTPVSAFLKTASGDYSFLLESVEGQEKVARYSFLGSNPSLVFSSRGRDIRVQDLKNGKERSFTTDSSPVDEIKEIMGSFRTVHVPGLPRFYGGLVGYIGYDMVRFFENIPDKNADAPGSPDSVLMLTDTILIFDHVNHSLKIVSNVVLNGKPGDEKYARQLYAGAVKRIREIEEDFRLAQKDGQPGACALRKRVPAGQADAGVSRQVISSNCSPAEYKDSVQEAKKYIRAGDIIQVVLSQRFSVKIKEDPFAVYRRLRSLNPSPYMFFLKMKDTTLIGASPEMLVRCEEGIVQARPIAGTRPRGKNEDEDAALARELINDVKERAEHLMLVDLGRNDLGRVCETGSVAVHEFMTIEKYSHVMHLVSEVRGKLDRRHYDIYDVLKASFPAGTVSGSPKIRAMEIIDELENTRRGPYAGCVGYFSFSHNMDTCITIRTIVVRGGTAYVQAGAGIVADSVPEREYEESVNKAKALMVALAG